MGCQRRRAQPKPALPMFPRFAPVARRSVEVGAAGHLMSNAQAGDTVCDLGLLIGAGDENRTRTISLGMSARMPLTSASAGRQAVGLSVSTRERPY